MTARTLRRLCLVAAMLVAVPASGRADAGGSIPTLREQAAIRDAWLGERLDSIVPALMRRERIDMWLLVAREGMDDPVLRTMLPADSFGARRRTIVMFHDPGGGRPVERLAIGRYALGKHFAPAWNPETEPNQWRRLAALVAERSPARIAINSSSDSAYADGLTGSQYRELVEALGPELANRIVPADALSIGWLETRVPGEIDAYRDAVRLTRQIVREAFSVAVIAPGRTTTDDVAWWLRERIAGLGLDTWFQPSVGVARQGADGYLEDDAVIMPGDLVWTDLGIVYLGLHTDMQQLAYMPRGAETAAPAGLVAGLRANNAVQDELMAAFRGGDSGNEVLARAREAARRAGLEPTIYSHPIGYHGHAAGPSIGFWDNQQADPRGSGPVRAGTAWSIELSATVAVPEWGGQRVAFRTEEDAWFDGERVRLLDGRQTELILVR